MRMTLIERILFFLSDLSIKTNLPLLLYLAFLPGFLLWVLLVEKPFGVLWLLTFLTLVLWELKALDDHDGKLSEVFKPILVMFPYVCLSGHFAYLIYKWILPNTNIVTTDKTLTDIWIMYVTVALICIIVSKTKIWLKLHKFR